MKEALHQNEAEQLYESHIFNATKGKIGGKDMQMAYEQNFRTYFDIFPLGVRIVNDDAKTLYNNQAILDIWGFDSAEDLDTTPKFQRYTVESAREAIDRRDRRKRGLPVPDRYDISIVRKKDGEVRSIKVYRKEIIWGGKTEYLTIYEDITNQKRAEEMSKALSRRLIEIQEEERTNIARELHDQIGQSLNMVKILLDRASNADRKDYQDLLKVARPLLSDIIDQVSTLSLDLRPKILDDLGLVQALTWYFNRFSIQTKILVQFESSDIGQNIETQISNTIYRVVQEALTNVARHSHASIVKVRIGSRKNIIELHIEDEGIGFDLAAIDLSKSGGIVGMKERIHYLGGTLCVRSKPGSGSHIIATIPYKVNSNNSAR